MMDHVFSVQAIFRIYHYYKAIGKAAVDACKTEVFTLRLVLLLKDIIVSDCQRKNSLIHSMFLRCGDSTTCQVNEVDDILWISFREV